MTNSKSTKRALLTSALAMLMCVAMLIGTTFAWFTDSASTSVNKIQAGNLDLGVEYTLDGEEWKKLESATDLFGGEDALFEPGYTRVVAFKISNNGNLALKYKMSMNIVSETKGVNKFGNEFALSDYLKVKTSPVQAANYIGDIMVSLAFDRDSSKAIGWTEHDFNDLIIDRAANGQEFVISAGGEAHYFIMQVYMPETVGNEANAISTEKTPSIDFGVNVLATQATIEKDSYDNQYDKNAEYATPVASSDELAAAIANGEDVVLSDNVALPDALEVKGDVTIYGNGTYKLNTSDTRVINVNGNTEPVTLTLSGVNIDAVNSERGISVYGNSNVTIVMDNCSASADHYALNIAGGNTNAEVIVRNTTLTGYSAFQTWSSGTNATFENCTLIGNNKWSGSSDNYAAIVIVSDALNSTLTFKNCRIEANELGSADEVLLDARATGANVTFDGCEFFVNDTEVTGDAIQNNMKTLSDTALTIK